MTSWPWASLAIFAPVFAVLGQTDVDLPTPDLDPDRARWWWVPVGIAVFLVGSVLLNVTRTVVTNWGLTVDADGDSIRRSSGLLARRLDARDAGKVQVVSTARNPAQRLAGLSALTLSTIGEGSLEVIGCDDAEIAALARSVGMTPMSELDPPRRIHGAEVFLAVRNASIAAIAIAVAAAWMIGWWALLTAVVVPIAWIRRHRHVTNFRWDITSDELFTRGRIIDEWTEQSLLRTTNGVRVSRSLFERRRHLGTVEVETAAGTVTVGMLTVDEANALRDRVLASVLLDDRPWM